LVAQPQVAGVMFTGSTQVAKLIQAQLAQRLGPDGKPVPFIAETGGQNAMIVDSSALPEQVVADVVASAFDSAGQRCSALRVLCLQDEIADRTITMLKGAMAELHVGPTDRISTDVGPVITAEALAGIEAHVAAMQAAGHVVHRAALGPDCAHGTFAAPTLIEIDDLAQLGAEVFGPVLHILRFRRRDLDALLGSIATTGYGLTFGLHTRLDSTCNQVLGQVHCGNLYVNRNVIGAVVGVQPFGGSGLSGTGPKAGGPLYLTRLARGAAMPLPRPVRAMDPDLAVFIAWLEQCGHYASAQVARAYDAASPVGSSITLPGPVGELNTYSIKARGVIQLHASSQAGLFQQIAAVLASGSSAVLSGVQPPSGLPPQIARRLAGGGMIAGALVEGDSGQVLAVQAEIARAYAPMVPLQAPARRIARPAKLTASIGCARKFPHRPTPRQRAEMPA